MSASVAFLLGTLVGALLVAAVALWRVQGVRTRLAGAEERLRLLEPSRAAEQAQLGPLLAQTQHTITATLERIVAETLGERANEAASSAASRLTAELAPRLAELTEAQEQLRRVATEARAELERTQASAASQLRVELTQRAGELAELARAIGEALGQSQQTTGSIASQLQAFLLESERVRTQVAELTEALRRSPKARGNWGELVLENLLAGAGLHEPRDFERQVALHGEGGQRLVADAVIHLPEGRHLVIDAKVQLVDYVRAIEHPEDATAARAHADALKAQVVDLANHRYDLALPGALDGVFLFVPIESALSLALDVDPTLVEEAMRRGIFLATPTTLIPVAKMVAFLWRGAERDRRAEEAEELAHRLAEKIANFAESFAAVGTAIDRAQRSWEEARGRLIDGRGSAASLAKRLAAVSGRTTKPLPAALEPREGADAEELP
jgi:DNA recombination protein RmuC